jgi:ApaG protein
VLTAAALRAPCNPLQSVGLFTPVTPLAWVQSHARCRQIYIADGPQFTHESCRPYFVSPGRKRYACTHQPVKFAIHIMNTENNHNIIVEVETSYVEGQSEPDNERYVFSYTITIRNEGGQPAQLLSRHWIITDAHGNIQEVKGEGVVGEQPHLNPGEGFQYTSGAMISTPVGSMRGTYQMLADDGNEFDAEIPPFTLAIPRTLH